MEIAALILLLLLLLAALVAFGIGSRRWNWAAVAGSILIVLTLGGYVYLATQLLHFEWEWAQAVRSTRLQLYRTRDALSPSTRPEDRGRLVKLDGEKSIAELREDEVRWRRALERVETWRGRYWDDARFEPPDAEAITGTITLPAPPPPAAPADGGDAPEEPAPAMAIRTPPEAGELVYLFDARPIGEGGRYLGGWRVTAVAGQQLTVEPLTPPDADDRQAWLDQSGTVTIYDELPSDRWLAFSETPRLTRPPVEADAAGVAAELGEAVTPQPTLDLERLERDETLSLPENLKQDLAEHTLSAADVRERVDPEQWPTLREKLAEGSMETLPGEYWAEIRFEDQSDMEDFLGFSPDLVPGVEPSLSVEVDLESAFQAEAENNATVTTVFRRRRLLDTGTLASGSMVPVGKAADDVVRAEGLAALARQLERDIAILEESQTRLQAARDSATAERALVAAEIEDWQADLAAFTRDAEAATRLADAFQAEAEQAARRLSQTEQAVVDLGRKLDAVVREAVEEIDRIAPPPQARGGGRAAF